MDKSSIGIIGGADGPTKIFITGNPLPAIIAAVMIAAVIVVVIVFLKKRKYWKIALWASLFVLSVLGFIASIVLKREATIISLLISMLMAGWWLIVEIRKSRNK